MTHEQAGLVWMAAHAFNMGIKVREDRTQESINEMEQALDEMKRLFNFHVEGAE